MIKDIDLEKVSVMSELIAVVRDAAVEGIIDRPAAGRHITMYLSEISQIIKPGESNDGPNPSE